jgi:hypothetical protein
VTAGVTYDSMTDVPTLTSATAANYAVLYSNLTAAEDTYADTLNSFNTNGFTLGNDSWGGVNTSGRTYVGWQWQAGQGSSSSNTDGSITSTVSVNASAGFSVVTYTGTGANATVGHGLGVAPKMVIIKRRSATESWAVFHDNLSSAAYCLLLNLTNAQTLAAAVFNSTAPTSSVISVGTDTATNASTSTYVAYSFAEIDGFSKFGQYTGNGSADGPFVYLGFRPRYIFIKRKDTAGFPWWILDTARNTYNVADLGLLTNTSDSESSAGFPYTTLDFVSNGIKLRNTAGGINASGGTYIYAAFAENPFKNSLAR